MIKRKILLITVLAFIFFNSSCEKNKHLEEKIINEIFIEMAIKMQLRVIDIQPIAPPLILDENNIQESKKELLEYYKYLREYSNYLREYYFYNSIINPKSFNVVVGLNNELSIINNENLYNHIKGYIDLKNKKYLEVIRQNIANNTVESNIDFNYIENVNPFKILNKNELGWTKSENDKFRNEKEFYLAGVLNLSKIYFNNEMSMGYFLCSEIANGKETLTKLLFIEKESNKWKIIEEVFLY
ncbi:hypothetical protein [Wenyingzhuangia sp. IMCC45467]